MQEQTAVRKYVTIEQAKDVTSFSRSFLYDLMTGGKLEYVTVGRTRRIPLDSLMRLMEDHTVKARAGAAS